MPLVQTGYTSFIKLLDTSDYRQYQTQAYVRDKDLLWKTDTRYKRAEIERAVFYHCDQVGTPQVLSNESGEQVWAVTLDTWGQALEIKANAHLLEQTNIRFQGHERGKAKHCFAQSARMLRQAYTITAIVIMSHIVRGISEKIRLV